MKIIRVINYILIVNLVYLSLFWLLLLFNPSDYFLDRSSGFIARLVRIIFPNSDAVFFFVFSLLILLIVNIIIYKIVAYFFDKKNNEFYNSMIIKNIVLIFLYIFFNIILMIAFP